MLFNGTVRDRNGTPLALGWEGDSDRLPPRSIWSATGSPAARGRDDGDERGTRCAHADPRPDADAGADPDAGTKASTASASSVTANCGWPIIEGVQMRVGFTTAVPLYVRPGVQGGSWPVPVTVAYLGQPWTFSDLVSASVLATELRVALRAVSPDGTTKRWQVTTRLSDLTIPATGPMTTACA